MVIGFAGRMRSGKTELAKVCESKGYRRLYFALPLKQLCADLLDISMDELNRAKNEGTDIGLFLGDDMCTILSEETEIPLDTVREICYGKTINNVREMLQFVGTDLIRKYNEDWHVNRVRQMIEDGYDYVIDDVRFPNEKRMIEELGGDCWFISKTSLDNISNHESETSLTWHNCWNKIIINNGTLHYLLFRWENFMDDYSRSCALRDKEFNRILENGLTNEVGRMPEDAISALDMLLLPACFFTYNPKELLDGEIKEMKMLDSGDAQVKYSDNTIEIIDNPLVIEDLKMYL